MSVMGTIYVLANPNIPGLVKVGKTTRSVDERMKELSSATGVPSEFILIYEQLFVDVDSAERQIHAILETKGFRHATNREFFNASPTDVIKIINNTKGKAGDLIDKDKETISDNYITENDDEDDEFGGLNETKDVLNLENFPWYETWIEGENHYWGYDGYIQDYTDAFESYSKAIKMGCPFAFQRIGDMFLNGEGMSRSDKNKALEYYKQGVKKGNYYCYLKMGTMYCEDRNFENTKKCFDYFIDKFSNKDDLIESENNTFFEIRIFILATYKTYSFTNEQKIFIKSIKQEIIENNQISIDYIKNKYKDDNSKLLMYTDLNKYLTNL